MRVEIFIGKLETLSFEDREKVLERLAEIGAAKGCTMHDKTFERAANRVLDRHAELLQKLAQ